MKHIFLSFLIFINFSSEAGVSSENGHSSLVVNSVDFQGKEYISFKFCKAGTKCRFLGNREFYSREYLEDKRFDERLEIAYSTVADIGVGVFALWASLTAAVAYGTSVAVMIPAGASAGVITPVVSGSVIDSLNPAEQYRQSRTLSNDVLDGEEIVLDSENDLFDFVSRLELVLNK